MLVSTLKELEHIANTGEGVESWQTEQSRKKYIRDTQNAFSFIKVLLASGIPLSAIDVNHWKNTTYIAVYVHRKKYKRFGDSVLRELLLKEQTKSGFVVNPDGTTTHRMADGSYKTPMSFEQYEARQKAKTVKIDRSKYIVSKTGKVYTRRHHTRRKV